MKPAESLSELNLKFYAFLKKLVGMPTSFWEEQGISDALAWCSEAMAVLPDHWANFIDAAGNLIVYNILADNCRPMLYLCSHIDTVGADPGSWRTPPFTATETADHIIGRGANDCKAGTAMQLTLAWLLAGSDSRSYNLGFLFMFREEGNQGKTSSKLDFSSLPKSRAGTYIITLENTLQVHPGGPYTLGIYDREPHNLLLSREGLPGHLAQEIDPLEQLLWKPVNIHPMGGHKASEKPEQVIPNPQHGHTATLSSSGNILKQVLQDSGQSIGRINTGSRDQASVVSPSISVYGGPPQLHELIYNYRGFNDLEQVRLDLAWLNYRETYGFELGAGSDQRSSFEASGISSLLEGLDVPGVRLARQSNPGRSDASAIWNILTPDQRQYILPFAMGPGCRTHTDRDGIRRATHGNDEGFYKPAAGVMISLFWQLIEQFKHESR